MTVHKKRNFLKTLGKLFFILLGIGLALYLFLWVADFFFSTPLKDPVYGVTFSPPYAEYLGFNADQVYQSLLDNLQVKHLRIPVNWNRVQKTPEKYDFGEYDHYLDEAGINQVQVILALGYKVPRWPECTPPTWANNLDDQTFKYRILELLQAEVNHFKNRPEVTAWQVENEPLFAFGQCRTFDESFLAQEVALVHSLDSRPVILTDSGELGTWVTAMRYSDIMGTSLYRIVWNPLFGYTRYPLPPFYYQLKARVTQALFAPMSHQIFVSELQAEPWSPNKVLPEIPVADQAALFTLKDLQNVVIFTDKTQIKDQYFWGVEWWYYMKEHGHPEYWNFAKTLFR